MSAPWNADKYGMTPDDWRAMAWHARRYDDLNRLRALRALWGKPIRSKPRDSRVGWTVYDDHERNRAEEWTFWRALRATVALVLGWRGHSYKSVSLCYWDCWPVYGGYSGMSLSLHGWTVEIVDEGEICM